MDFLETGRLVLGDQTMPTFTNEFWTSKQRQAAAIHEISYRACFKPQLPRFFIERFSAPGDKVYDPFLGRGTTAIEAALLGRVPVGNDVNPLSLLLTRPRLRIPSIEEVADRLARIKLSDSARADVDLSMFYHPKTQSHIVSLRRFLLARERTGECDAVDDWIRMVATNRLTGHSKGFFSVYTLPPNQAATQDEQRRINERLRQSPLLRDVKEIVLRKTASLLRGLTEGQRRSLRESAGRAIFTNDDARATPGIESDSIQLTVTSPPFLDIVEYAKDNWLRCWFNGIDAGSVGGRITMSRAVPEWSAVMAAVLRELHRVTKPAGYLAFEVGEIRRGRIRLDERIAPIGVRCGFKCMGILINQQKFTKTSNIWGVSNNAAGTNTNRIVFFQKLPR